ncbi:peptidylprolyl isomerase/peptidyl-prolyl cis-trans isomerase D [Ulvibacter sp. MAR_2010_11]|uniref:peptidylprolyl isomerase n=1 Tax=Ulvibacter sp. MAR_2010_11 TaxID=1250229 RepID=UPI000C2BC579|nr:peptidylprolyl isomerase [Ulvibacter sp. MAR_2010_11]PKA82517.1 peptidylprolyl isomerase/peptidyl-prolyl cis-trans isomerase D [Ulvibacter sp. MAR_2010_11]
MAVLNSIRKRGVFLIVIIALALFSFVLADVIRNGGMSTDKGQTNVATVNGVDIPRQEFMEKVEVAQRSLGPNAPSSQAMDIVWERELRRVLMEEQYEEIGLVAETEFTNNALSRNLASNPTFQDESGAYSEAKMLEYVADVKANNPQAYDQWLEYVKNTKQTALENTYLNLVKGGMIATSADGEKEYRFQSDKINIEFVQIPYTNIPDDQVPVSDDEIAKYVKSHAKEFEVEPMVDIQYVSYVEEPSQEDIEAAKAEIATLKDYVLISGDTLPGLKNTTSYEEFVNANSDNAYSDSWYYKNELPDALKDTIFKMNVGDIYGPYQINNSLSLTKLIGTRQLPDTVSVRHILIPAGLNPTDNKTRTDEQAKATADSIMAVVKANRSKFPEIVTAMSSDKGSIEKGGRYENFVYTAMVPEFRDYSFENKKGDIGVVKTQFGYHIIEIENQKNFETVIKTATVTKVIDASETTINDIFSKATAYEVEAQKGDFTKIAESQNAVVKPVNKIGELDSNIPGLGSNRSIVTWAFDEDTEVGDVKRFNVGTGYVIAQLTRKNQKGLMSVAEASTKVTPILRNEKKAKKIRESVTGSTLQEIAASQKVTVKNATAITMASPTLADAGTEPKVVGAAFGKKAGEETGFIDGKTGVFKVRVLAVNKAPNLDNYTTYSNQLNAKVVPTVNTNLYKALKKTADIEDNRASFY